MSCAAVRPPPTAMPPSTESTAPTTKAMASHRTCWASVTTEEITRNPRLRQKKSLYWTCPSAGIGAQPIDAICHATKATTSTIMLRLPMNAGLRATRRPSSIPSQQMATT
jgi:hypothetical protein